METRNGIHVIDCSNIRKPLREIQDTEAFKTFAEDFGNALKLNGIVYLINTEVENDMVSNKLVCNNVRNCSSECMCR